MKYGFKAPRLRNSQTRYVYPEDRKDLHRWLLAPGPCEQQYKWLSGEKNRLVIEICKNGRFSRYEIPREDLLYARDWRRMVARVVRQVRWYLSR